jgi:hypothetical protein
MNTTPQGYDTFEATVIRISRESTSTRAKVDFVSDLAPDARSIRLSRVRTGRTDTVAARLLARHIKSLIGHRVSVKTAMESNGYARRIIGVIDLGADPHFVEGDPRTEAEPESVRVPKPTPASDLEAEFTGDITAVQNLGGGILAVHLNIGPDFTIQFISFDDAVFAPTAQSLLGKRATIAGLPHGSPSGANTLLLTRISAAG